MLQKKSLSDGIEYFLTNYGQMKRKIKTIHNKLLRVSATLPYHSVYFEYFNHHLSPHH